MTSLRASTPQALRSPVRNRKSPGALPNGTVRSTAANGLVAWAVLSDAVLLGDQIAKNLSMTQVHGVAAAIFAVLGGLTLFNVGQPL